MKKLFPYLLSAVCLYTYWLLAISVFTILVFNHLHMGPGLPEGAAHFRLIPLFGLQIPISSMTQYSFWCAAFGWLLVGMPLVFFRQKLAFVFNPKYSLGWGMALSIVFTFIAREVYPYPEMRSITLSGLYSGICGLLQGQMSLFIWILFGMIGYLFSLEFYGPLFIGGLSLWSFSWLYHQEKLFFRLSRLIPFYCISLSILLGSTLFLYWYGGFPVVGYLTGLWPGAWAKGQMMLHFSDLTPPSR